MEDTMAAPRYLVEVRLKSGGPAISEDVTEAQADEHVATGRFIWPGERDQAWKQRAAITTLIAERLQKGSGLLSVTDKDGGQWLIPSENIAAVKVRDREDSPDAPETKRRPIGFEPITVRRDPGGQAATS